MTIPSILGEIRRVRHEMSAAIGHDPAWIVNYFASIQIMASGGMKSSPLYGLAFMQLVLAFFHPATLESTRKSE
jgi:hypothetical protein